MDALSSSETDFLEAPYEAEAIERSALKRVMNFVRRKCTCEPAVKGYAKELRVGVK